MAASWSILGKLGLTTTQFESALNKAKGEAANFGKEVALHAKEAREQLADVAKETGGGKFASMLGLAGTGVAATAFGVAVVEAMKGGLEAFGHFETKVLELKANLKDPSIAKEVTEWVESISGAGGKFDDLFGGMRSLLESGLGLEESKTLLTSFAAEAIKTGASVTELAEAFRKARAGGLDAGEGASRLLKSIPDLAPMIQPLIDQEAAKFRRTHTTYQGDAGTWKMSEADQAEYEKLKSQTPADYVKGKQLTTQNLEDLLNKNAPRGLIEEKKKTVEGAEAEFHQKMDVMMKNLGEALAPSFKQIMADLMTEMPKLTPLLIDFGHEVARAATWIIDHLAPAMQAVKDTVSGVSGWGEESVQHDWENHHPGMSYRSFLANPAGGGFTGGFAGSQVAGEAGASRLALIHAELQRLNSKFD